MAQQFPRPTKTYRASPYAAIMADRPELSLAGQTVLITGGATGIGLATTKAFAAAGAAKIIILARFQANMTQAKEEIEKSYPKTKVITYACSITDFEQVNQIIQKIGTIDILVLSAGVLHKPQPVLQIDAADVHTTFDVNVLGPLNMIKAFVKLPKRSPNSRRTIIYTSAWGINFVMHGTGAYSASKAAMTYFMRCIDEENDDPNLRTFAFHPAVAYTPMARDSLGMQPDSLAFDSTDLPAHYAVWLCSPEADFLKGRFVSANWDVEELMSKKDVISNNASLLKNATFLGELLEQT